MSRSQLWFHANNVCFVLKTWNAVKTGASVAPGLQGPNNLKICPLPYLRCYKSCTHNRQSFAITHSYGSVQVPEKQGQRPALLCLLKPKQDYLISLRVSSTLIYRIGILTCQCNEEEEETKLLCLRSWTRIQVY